MIVLEYLLRLHGETLLYVIFFGAIAGFGLLETVAAMRKTGADRRHRWPTNWALTALNIALLGALPVSALLIAGHARANGIGLFNMHDLPLWSETGLAMLAFSFQSWAVHLLMHKVPVLWRVHRVHHTDTHLDVSTTVRFHPLEFLIQLPVSATVILALGAPPVAVILYELLDAAINVFSHANIRLPHWFDRILSRVIVTPHLHRVHHSTHQPETDSNFGATLPLWDMVFGTYRAKTPHALARQSLGLNEMQDTRSASLWWALSLPFRDIRKPEKPGKPDDGNARPANL